MEALENLVKIRRLKIEKPDAKEFEGMAIAQRVDISFFSAYSTPWGYPTPNGVYSTSVTRLATLPSTKATWM
ncbi:MAG: hypothetical protein HLUCCX14_00520 [Marinobacter excellens HL-55]|uniref:Uncharacterized protein n=1 Tax=Marinobacter excellens HL-55 TaxID=1305731 RepID=A0A0P7YLV1_9GAMM|nr:MAG: hypothetical protein HLUCCX14_00520 [Marinobacter excellens HL-55]